jgi:hypothetical protein
MSMSTVAIAEVSPVSTDRKWTFIPSGKTVIYGVPERDEVAIRITCPDGIDQLRYEFVYNSKPTPWEKRARQKPDPNFPSEEQAGPVLIQIDGKKLLAGGSGKIEKYEFGDELQGWNVAVPDVKWQIEEILKRDGIATVSTGPGWEEGTKWSQPPVAQYKIALKGARSAIDRLGKACR